MPKKEEGPLSKVQKEGDQVKKKVESFVAECQTHINDPKADRNATNKLYKTCTDLQGQVDVLHRKAAKLKPENEPIKVDKFADKAADEMRRIDNLKKSLERCESRLNPKEEEESEEESGEEESEEEESGEEESGEEESKEAESKKVPDKQGKVRKVGVEVEDTEDTEDDSEESGEEDEEESEEGETVDDEAETETGEDETEDDGETEEDESEESETEEETESETETDGVATATNQLYEALSDYEGKRDGDLSMTAGEVITVLEATEDGWWLAENEDGKQGIVPVTYLQVHNKYKDLETPRDDEQDPKTPRSGRMLWKNIKQAVKEQTNTVILKAVLDTKRKDEYTLRHYLTPKLSTSCVGYRDLFFDPVANKIRTRASRILRIVTIQACRQIPPPGAALREQVQTSGIEINSRHVRVCLFDGQNMLSNVHTVRVVNVDKDQRTWNFSNKVMDQMRSLEFGELFVRSNQMQPNIGILFELCMSYIRPSTSQSGEFSCGWVHLPLFDSEQQPTPNKSYDLHVNGGTPFEKGVDVDPSAGRKAGSSVLRTLMAGNKQPRLVVRLAQPTREQKDLLDTLPDVVLSATTYIQYLSFYRQLLTDALLRDTDNVMSIEPIHSPVLNLFPSVADYPDLMDVLRASWAEKMKSAKRVEKKDPETLKDMFKKVFMERVYPLYMSASIPAYKFGEPSNEKERYVEIQRLSKMNTKSSSSSNPVPACLLSADTVHAPFDITEISFSVIGQQHGVHSRH